MVEQSKSDFVKGYSGSVGETCFSLKYCPSDGKLCSNSSCDFLDSNGNVRICRRHKNRGGFHLRRRLALPVVPVFNKHLRLFVFILSVRLELLFCWVAVILSGRTVLN